MEFPDANQVKRKARLRAEERFREEREAARSQVIKFLSYASSWPVCVDITERQYFLFKKHIDYLRDEAAGKNWESLSVELREINGEVCGHVLKAE